MEPEAAVSQLDRGRDRRRAVAQLHLGALDRNEERAGDVHMLASQRFSASHDDRVRARLGAQDVQRAPRGDPEAAPLSRRETPEAAVTAELVALFVEDRPVLACKSGALEEVPVVGPGEEAGLLALRAPGGFEPGPRCLGPGLLLRLLAEREPDTAKQPRSEAGQHVRLILPLVRGSREQEATTAADDPRVVAGGQAGGPGPVGERQQLCEPEAPVAGDARVRRFSVRVAADERLHDLPLELAAQVERHMRATESMAGLAGGHDGLRGAAGPLGARPRGIEPQAKRDADRVRAGAEQRDRAVDPAAHRDGDARGRGLRPEDRPESARKRVDGKRLASHGRGLEQRQPLQVALEPVGISVDDSLAVGPEPDEGPLASARRITRYFDHVGEASNAYGRSPRLTGAHPGWDLPGRVKS